MSRLTTANVNAPRKQPSAPVEVDTYLPVPSVFAEFFVQNEPLRRQDDGTAIPPLRVSASQEAAVNCRTDLPPLAFSMLSVNSLLWEQATWEADPRNADPPAPEPDGALEVADVCIPVAPRPEPSFVVPLRYGQWDSAVDDSIKEAGSESCIETVRAPNAPRFRPVQSALGPRLQSWTTSPPQPVPAWSMNRINEPMAPRAVRIWAPVNPPVRPSLTGELSNAVSFPEAPHPGCSPKLLLEYDDRVRTGLLMQMVVLEVTAAALEQSGVAFSRVPAAAPVSSLRIEAAPRPEPTPQVPSISLLGPQVQTVPSSFDSLYGIRAPEVRNTLHAAPFGALGQRARTPSPKLPPFRYESKRWIAPNPPVHPSADFAPAPESGLATPLRLHARARYRPAATVPPALALPKTGEVCVHQAYFALRHPALASGSKGLSVAEAARPVRLDVTQVLPPQARTFSPVAPAAFESSEFQLRPRTIWHVTTAKSEAARIRGPRFRMIPRPFRSRIEGATQFCGTAFDSLGGGIPTLSQPQPTPRVLPIIAPELTE